MQTKENIQNRQLVKTIQTTNGQRQRRDKQHITRFHVSPHILLHTWDETWGLLQQVSGDGAKICYKIPVLLKVAFGHLFYLQRNNQGCSI